MVNCIYSTSRRLHLSTKILHLRIYQPETSDLSFRFGMHSGPVTAGVLRGQKSRFQLFGDTVNTGKNDMLMGASRPSNVHSHFDSITHGKYRRSRQNPMHPSHRKSLNKYRERLMARTKRRNCRSQREGRTQDILGDTKNAYIKCWLTDKQKRLQRRNNHRFKRRANKNGFF